MLRNLMQGKIYKIVKILWRMNSRTVMMERFQDVEFSWHCCPQKTVMIPRSVVVLYLLFTQPSLIRSFHSSDRCFSVSCPKGVGYARVYCTTVDRTRLSLAAAALDKEPWKSRFCFSSHWQRLIYLCLQDMLVAR